MNKTLRNSLVITLSIAVLGIIKIFFLSGSADEQKKQGSGGKDKKVQPVTIYVVNSETLENKITSAGTIISDMEAQLKPEISGRVIKISFSEGKSVRKGQLLVKLNDADLQAQLRKLKIQLKLIADKELRTKKLLSINGVSQEEYDNVFSQLESLKADADLLQAQIDKTEIRAPFDGIVGLKSVDEGQYISPTNVVASIQKINPVKIDFSVPEQYSSLINQNSTVVFKIKGNTEKYSAKIFAIEPKIDPSTRSLLIRAKCDNSKGKIFPGSFAEVELNMQKTENALLIPSEALIPILKGQKVFLFKSGKAKEVKVKSGIRTTDRIQIVEGIVAGDTVITTGIMQISDGSTVKISKKK
jgi:membrane fusion protein (multidrug efflux system)